MAKRQITSKKWLDEQTRSYRSGSDAASASLARDEMEVLRRKTQWFNAVAQVFTRSDRILTNKDYLQCAINVEGSVPPSYTDQKQIVFQVQEQFKALVPGDNAGYDDTLIDLLGLNYHELAHCLFTPTTSRRSDFGRKLHSLREQLIYNRWYDKAASLDNVFNILEDQRIERLLVAKWPSTKPYLQLAIHRHILSDVSPKKGSYTDDKELFARQYWLLAGRHFLLNDKSIKDVRQAFVNRHGHDLADDLDKCVYAYQDITFPTDSAKAIQLIEQFLDLLHSTTDGLDMNITHSDNERSNPSFDKRQQDQAQQEAKNDDSLTRPDFSQDDADDADDKSDAGKQSGQQSESNDDADDKSDNQSVDRSQSTTSGNDDNNDDPESDSQESTFGEAGDKLDGDRDANESSSQGSGEQFDDGQANSDDKSYGSSSAPGTGASANHVSLDNFQEQLREAAEAVRNEDALKADLKEWNESISNTKKFDIRAMRKIGESVNTQTLTPTADSIMVSRKVRKSFDLLVEDADPGWVSERDSGRVNIGRVIQRRHDSVKDYDGIFDSWNEGNASANDMEVVIAVDLSTSVYSLRHKLSQAVWVLRRALDFRGANVTVLGFNTGCFVLNTADERPSRTELPLYQAEGGTRISTALEVTQQLMKQSSKSHKLFFVLTDGDFADHEIVLKNRLGAMQRSGVSTSLIGFGCIGAHVMNRQKQYFNQAEIISDLAALPDYIAKTIKSVINSQNRGR